MNPNTASWGHCNSQRYIPEVSPSSQIAHLRDFYPETLQFKSRVCMCW